MNDKKTRHLIFCAPSLWRKLFLFQKNDVFKMKERFIYSRSSTILYPFINNKVKIHSGKKWHYRFLTKWSVGFKFGELTWNRRIALYKAKQLRKKKKKKMK